MASSLLIQYLLVVIVVVVIVVAVIAVIVIVVIVVIDVHAVRSIHVVKRTHTQKHPPLREEGTKGLPPPLFHVLNG